MELNFLPKRHLQTAEHYHLSPHIVLLRRPNGERWREPVNGRRHQRTARFLSVKNGGRPIACESSGELALFQFIEIYPSIPAYREQVDLFQITDPGGTFYTLPDLTVDTVDGGPVWIEGKYKDALGSRTAQRLARIRSAFWQAGLSYVVLDEGYFRSPIIRDNVNIIFGCRNVPVSVAQRQVVLKHVRAGNATVGSCSALLAGHDMPEAVVCALMAQGHLEIELERKFSAEAPVSVPTRPFWVEG